MTGADCSFVDILRATAQVLGVDVNAFGERRRNSALRAVAGRMLIRFGGLTQREAALCLKMGTGGAVSSEVRRLPTLLAKNEELQDCVIQIERTLEPKRTRTKRRQWKQP